jgi:hypothetical protein
VTDAKVLVVERCRGHDGVSAHSSLGCRPEATERLRAVAREGGTTEGRRFVPRACLPALGVSQRASEPAYGKLAGSRRHIAVLRPEGERGPGSGLAEAPVLDQANPGGTKMTRALALLPIILMIPCLLGAEDWPAACPDRSYVELSYPALMTTCPAGDGPAFEDVVVFAVTPDGDPIVGLPSSQFAFTIDGNVTVTPVEEATNDKGRIRFTLTSGDSIVRVGADWLHVECAIAGVALNDADSLHVNSFDLNADGCVDKQDVAVFQSLYLQKDLRADYYRDGVIDMRDFSVLVDHDGHCAPKDEEVEPAAGEAVEAGEEPAEGGAGD